VSGTIPSGDGGPATKAVIVRPICLTATSIGEIVVCESHSYTVRMINVKNDTIKTISGRSYTYVDEPPFIDGQAALDSFFNANAVAMVSSGNNENNIFLTDATMNMIRQVNLNNGQMFNTSGQIESGYFGDEGPAIIAKLSSPSDIGIHPATGNLIIVDVSNTSIIYS
jgi:hypothetical protein